MYLFHGLGGFGIWLSVFCVWCGVFATNSICSGVMLKVGASHSYLECFSSSNNWDCVFGL